MAAAKRRRLTCLAIAADEQQPDVGVRSLFIYSLARLKKVGGG